jgi:riboflavin biosynthesis pyrimidine reductase
VVDAHKAVTTITKMKVKHIGAINTAAVPLKAKTDVMAVVETAVEAVVVTIATAEAETVEADVEIKTVMNPDNSLQAVADVQAEIAATHHAVVEEDAPAEGKVSLQCQPKK